MGEMSSLAHQLLGLKDKLSMGSHTLPSDANAFCERLMEALLDRNRPFEESICGQEVAHVIWSVFVSAAKSGVSMEEFSAEVAKASGEGGTKAQEELAKAMCSAYEVGGTHPSLGIENARDLRSGLQKHGQALREAMLSIGWEYPKVVGVSWSILSVVESNDDDAEMEEPLAEITFTTLATGETPPSTGKFTFLCNKNQLLDIQWKVREAENFLRNVASHSSSTDGAAFKPKRTPLHPQTR